MLSISTTLKPVVRNYTIDEINTMPTNIDCLELGITSEQLIDLKYAGYVPWEVTIIRWKKVFDHIKSVKLIKIGLVPRELLKLLNDFDSEKRNSVTKLVFKQYAGAFCRWECSLCASFVNVNAMYFEKSDVQFLNFHACEREGMEYSADEYSLEKARTAHEQKGGDGEHVLADAKVTNRMK